MSDMFSEKCIDFYYGNYKNNFLGKKITIRLGIYPSNITGTGFPIYEQKLNNNTINFDIPFDNILNVYINSIGKTQFLCIEYISDSVVNSNSLLAFPGMQDINKWINILTQTMQTYKEKKIIEEKTKRKNQEERNKLIIEDEKKALNFYQECYSFHIKKSTPVYQLYAEKNKTALIYIDNDKSLNFLKIDGYTQEENNGIITYDNIHYYEKAGNISYVTDIHGNYSSYVGSMTGANFSKLAAVGGGVLFGLMGMAIGTALTYKPAEQKSTNTTLSIDSDIKKIDDRSVLLNFYSDVKKQYIDIELPQDVYNFFQTYFPEKKYSIVDELEKKTVVQQSSDLIKNGNLLKNIPKEENLSITKSNSQSLNDMNNFKIRVEKLKMMKEAGLLSDEQFAEEQTKLLKSL